MPIYEYTCNECSKAFEELIRAPREEQELVCPHCGSASLSRLPSVFAARSAAEAVPLPRGGCGRCGDPNGPCGLT